MKQTWLWAIAALLAALAAWHALQQGEVGATATLYACDLNQGPCALRLPGGQVARLVVEPRPLPVVTPLTLRLQAPAVAGLSGGLAQFTGVDMEMGRNLFVLEAEGSGGLTGNAMLPICTDERMAWRLLLKLDSPAGSSYHQLEFRSVRPGR